MPLQLPPGLSRAEREKWDSLLETASGKTGFRLDPREITRAVDDMFASWGSERAMDHVVSRKVRERILENKDPSNAQN